MVHKFLASSLFRTRSRPEFFGNVSLLGPGAAASNEVCPVTL